MFGLALKQDCSEKLFYGTDYHSHLATDYAGLAVFDDEIIGKIHDIKEGQFKSKFYEDYKKMKGNKGIGIIGHEPQPIRMVSDLGEFAICTNGLIINSDELVNYFLNKKIAFSDIKNGNVNQTELVGKLICEKDNFIEGIENMFDKIEGSMSVLVLTKEGIYAASDRFPLILGKSDDGFAITSETTAFPNLGFHIFKYLQPREIVFFDENEIKSREGKFDLKKICTFLWIYTGFPSSSYEGINAELAREKSGKFLALRDSVTADFVTGVPDSGLAHGIGYAMQSKIPFRRALVKYTPGWGRSYIPADQKERDLIANFKIIPIPEMIKDKDIIVTEDSIVRGTQLKNLLKNKVLIHKPKSVHIRSACPPLMRACKFNISTRKEGELAAWEAIRSIEGKDIEDISEYLDENSEKYKKMVEFIRQKIGGTTLKYQKLNDMVEAIGLPKENLCLHCWGCENFKRAIPDKNTEDGHSS